MIDIKTLDLVVDKLSEKYRGITASNNLLNKVIKDIKTEMKDEEVTYARMNELQFLLERKTGRYEIRENYANGIMEAREIVIGMYSEIIKEEESQYDKK